MARILIPYRVATILRLFDIANIPMPPMDHSQVTSGAGSMLYSKLTHTFSLLIATYYNFYGPDFYYKLHS